MVDRLFSALPPCANDSVLDPGCGEGEFIDGIIRWCASKKVQLPRIVGVESNPRHVTIARSRFSKFPSVEIRESDFLLDHQSERYNFIVGNPPYVPITELSEKEKQTYRQRFRTATGRFDLYLLFFEQALHLLKSEGRLVFITPEKFLYVETAQVLRQLLVATDVEEVRLINEETFQGLVTYPTITTISNRTGRGFASIFLRNGQRVRIVPPSDGSSWLPAMMQDKSDWQLQSLDQICIRISCGVATGADDIFVRSFDETETALRRFAYPTIAGRELGENNARLFSKRIMLIPYYKDSELIPESKLGRLREYLEQSAVQRRLERRTCVRRKPWYAFHETPPLQDILRPKILCKDITQSPKFWIDREGELVPRHSVYYIVPKDPAQIDKLCKYLNSEAVAKWLAAHCQRVANGFLRLQSHVLKRIPIPSDLSFPRRSRARLNMRNRREDVRTRQLEFGR